MKLVLINSGWLLRVFEISTCNGNFIVEYNGRGIGNEWVLVDGKRVAGRTSWIWFIPRFDFQLDSKQAVIEVHIRPWLRIYKFSFSLNGEVLYSEP
ncbi:MAG: hypothetical protein SVY53_11845 [Chloroflexota bacterium]|nr:hypothetical protein [Chloroflexota bacterium]